MAAGSVTEPKPSPSWRLRDTIAPNVQGFVASGFQRLPTGRTLFLEFDWPDSSQPAGWLDRLAAVAPITNAVPPDKSDAASQTRAASIAFSGTGLRRMGLTDRTLDSFSRPFVEGMFQEDRLRRIGDRREGKWCTNVVDGGPLWSANTPPRDPGTAIGMDAPPAPSDEPIETAITVHALLLLYTLDEDSAEAWAGAVTAHLAADHITVVRRLGLLLDVEQQGNFSREHFGFADGLSQPIPFDKDHNVLIDGKPATESCDPVQGVPLGEIVLGYVNGHQEKAPGPFVEDDLAKAADLPPLDKAVGCFDLGLNGSYLVARELKQDVAAFWASMSASAAAIRARDPGNTAHVTGDWLAERVIGRDRDGHLLRPGGAKQPSCPDGSPDNSYLFFAEDPFGMGCPYGSHVRRAFPRDALAPKKDDTQTLLQAANNHRILRRGRKFGTAYAEKPEDNDRGLLFLCLNTDIERQFEFVQQTWLLNSAFATQFQEVDPLVGPSGRMTIRDTQLRHVVSVDTFVRLAGGDYFFLPGLPALRYLASL